MNRIAELRKKCGISQTDLAKKFGLAQNTLSQYENELRTPPTRVIAEMAVFFEVPENYLLGIDAKAKENVDLDSLDYRNVTKVTQTAEVNKTNILISLGWKLLLVGENKSVSEDGTGYSEPVFILGWYGDPSEAKIPHFDKESWAPDPEFYPEYYNNYRIGN